MMKISLAGSSAAATVAALFASGCTYYDATSGELRRTKTNDAVVAAAGASAVSVKCYGANSCKGRSSCKTAQSSCKGQNECKGQGFKMLDEMACINHFGRG